MPFFDKQKGQWFTPNHCPFAGGIFPPYTTRLLDFGLQISRSTFCYFNLKLIQLAFAHEGMPNHYLVLPSRDARKFERSIVLHDCMVWIPHREEEGLHEFVLVALQPVVA